MRRTMDLKSYLSVFVLKLLQKLSWLRLTQLTHVVTESIIQTGLQINTSKKKNLGRKIEIQFSTSLEMF